MLYDGDTFEHRGLTFRVEFPHDEWHGAPWEECDGHGPVSDWTSRAKRPGELILATDRHAYRYYDFQAAVALAKSDGWNAKPYDVPGETRGQRAAKAAVADFEFLRRWCNDDWCYVGVVVTLLDAEGEDVDGRSIWGIDSGSRDYLTDTAHELADELADEHAETLAAAIAAERPDLAPAY